MFIPSFIRRALGLTIREKSPDESSTEPRIGSVGGGVSGSLNFGFGPAGGTIPSANKEGD